MSRFLTYLAGPITGQSASEATGWREHAADRLDDVSDGLISCLDPMRGKYYLQNETNLADTYDEYVMSSQRGIYGRDRNDALRADCLLVNLLGAERVSIGTVMEIAWADSRKTPIVLVMEREGNPHEHAMLREACYWRVEDLESGILAVREVLVP